MHPFDNFPFNVQETLKKLEKRDSEERKNNVPKEFRLRQIPRETGEFLFQEIYHLAKGVSEQMIGLEIGTSGGYSTIFQAMALKQFPDFNHKIIALENDPEKIKLAEKNFQVCDLNDNIQLTQTDAKNFLQTLKDINFSFIFIDAEKNDYSNYLKLIKPYVLPRTILFADNVISHEEDLGDFITTVHQSNDSYSVIVPIGKGVMKVVYK